MWLFTTLGFFSATVSRDDKTKMQIRARERGDLENLVNCLGLGLPILETPRADYRFRIIVEPELWLSILAELGKGIDYSNFKNAVHDTSDQAHKGQAYAQIWAIMQRLQPRDHEPAAPAEDWPDYGTTDHAWQAECDQRIEQERAAEFRPEPFGDLLMGSPECKEPLSRAGKLYNPKAKKPRAKLNALRQIVAEHCGECNQCGGPLGDAKGITCAACLEKF